jgi:transcription elongation factor Elf1
MLCPRCEQGEVVEARIKKTAQIIYVCQECEATWFEKEKIGIEKFVDFGTYMEEHKMRPLWRELCL